MSIFLSVAIFKKNDDKDPGILDSICQKRVNTVPLNQ